MALIFLFSVSGTDASYDVKFDNVTLDVSVWDPTIDKEVFITDLTNPKDGAFVRNVDSTGRRVTFIGTSTLPYAAFPTAGAIIGTKCYGVDLYNLVADGNGYEEQGSLLEANSTSCGYVPNLVITPTVVHNICFGSSGGSISLNVSSGVPPYAYLWSDGGTSRDRFNLPAGNYSVAVTDSQGLKKTESNIAVGQNPEIRVTGQTDDDSIVLVVEGGLAPYTFLWSNGSTDQDQFGLLKGKYEVTVTDSVGCSKTFSFTLGLARFYFSHIPILLALQAENPETKPNLTFLCDVWVERDYLSGTFEKVAALEHVADKDGSTVFDVQEFLQPYVAAHFPEVGQNTVSRADAVFRRFYLRHTEQFGLVPVPDDFIIEDYRYVVRGGLSFEETPVERFFSQYLPARLPFMSWLPTTKLAAPEQPEFLYLLLHHSGVSAFNVRCRVTYTDATISTTTVFAQAGCGRFEVYCIPTGYAALNLGAVPDKTVQRWEVWAENTSGAILTEIRTYELDTRYFRNRRYLLYANSLGGVNTLAAVGLAEKELEVSTETMQRLLNPAYNAALGDTETTSVSIEPVLQLTSGYLDSQEELEALTDFVLSKEVRLLEAGRYRAGTRQVKKFTVLNEEDELKYLDFAFVLPVEKHFTPTL